MPEEELEAFLAELGSGAVEDSVPVEGAVDGTSEPLPEPEFVMSDHVSDHPSDHLADPEFEEELAAVAEVRADEPPPPPPRAMSQPAQSRVHAPGREAVRHAGRGGEREGLEEGLISARTTAAVNAAFNTLAQTVLVQNGRTLEDLVVEMLRPMLKTWLDDNLPGMVERLVRAEIERVSRGRG
jgi:cell pole-organizing protein PopZ